MRFFLILQVSIIIFKGASVNAHWAVWEGEMNSYVEKCVKLPSVSEMETELRASFAGRNKLKLRESFTDKNKSMLSRLGRGYKKLVKSLDWSEKKEYVEIDGFRMKNPSQGELEALLKITTHLNSAHFYKKKEEIKKDTLYITRKCELKMCADRARRDLHYIYNLETIRNKEPLCSDVICAAKRIFGDPKGVYLLHAQQTKGIQLSKYSDIGADKNGFRLKTLKLIISALNSTPEHLHKRTIHNSTFYPYLKGYKLKLHNESTIADATGIVYENMMDDYKDNRQIYIIAHEIGHRAGQTEDYGLLDEGDEWLNISGFSEVLDGKAYFKSYKKLDKRVTISTYGNTDPLEDFAETYAMYRFAPDRLRKRSPRRYAFMRDRVFNGIEYLNDICKGSKLGNKKHREKTLGPPNRGAR